MRIVFGLLYQLSLAFVRFVDRVIEHHQARNLPAATSPASTIDLTPEQIERVTVADTVADTVAVAVVNRSSCAVTAEVLPELSPDVPNDAQLEKNLNLNRNQTVQALLDEAWSLGHSTYPALIQYITTQTGKGCSRKTIAAWKKERGLIEAA